MLYVSHQISDRESDNQEPSRLNVPQLDKNLRFDDAAQNGKSALCGAVRMKRVKELTKERNRRYRERHRAEINRRRRENWHNKKNLQESHDVEVMPMNNDIEHYLRERRKKYLSRERQRRYREKNQDIINQRKRNSRKIVSCVEKSAGTHALDIQVQPDNGVVEFSESRSDVTVKETEQIKQRDKKYSQLVKTHSRGSIPNVHLK